MKKKILFSALVSKVVDLEDCSPEIVQNYFEEFNDSPVGSVLDDGVATFDLTDGVLVDVGGIFPKDLAAVDLAREFHAIYEDESKKIGWKTNEACRVDFDKLPSQNRVVMVLTCKRILEKLKGVTDDKKRS